MFDWLFKRSPKEQRESNRLIEPKYSNELDLSSEEQSQLEQTEQDLIQIRDALAQMLPSMSEKMAQLQAQLEEVSAKNVELQAQHAKLSEQTLASTQELDDLRGENEILLSGMFEAQEELERQILSQQEFVQGKVVLDGRFERLVKRYSNYVDYGQINIISVDGIAAMPEIIWEMTDVFFAGMVFETIKFKTLLKEGKMGLWISSMKKPEGKLIVFKDGATLFPELVKKDVSQQRLLNKIQTSHWSAYGAASSAIELSIKSKWRDISLPPEFDPQFWGACLQSFPGEFQRLPRVFRFEQAKLKQELVNPDYEHLWIELFDVSFGAVNLPKFEFRLGAAQCNGEAFSNLPKLEIPLVDGKIKPFESWYEESFDDYGGKFELRFDLNKKSLDLAVLSKLTQLDRKFIIGIVKSIPLILTKALKNNEDVSRPTATWVQFSIEINNLMESIFNNKNLRLKEKSRDNLAEPFEKSGSTISVVKLDNLKTIDMDVKYKNAPIQSEQVIIGTQEVISGSKKGT